MNVTTSDMKLTQHELIERLKTATRGMTHEMIATRVTLDPDSGCNPRREHVTHAFNGNNRYNYVLVGMANVFLAGGWKKDYVFTNDDETEPAAA